MHTNLQQQIEGRMKARNLTIYALEKKAGLNRSAVRNILQGLSKNPSVEILSAIAVALDCTLNDLVGVSKGNQVPFKSSNKTPAKNKISYAWKEDLYLSAVRTTSKFIAEKGANLSLDQINNLIVETYKYSLTKTGDTVDKDFCEWLINKNL